MTKKRKYCMNCIYTSREAYCYKRHNPCYIFYAEHCPFYEEKEIEIEKPEVKHSSSGWLERLCISVKSLLLKRR